MSGVVVLDVDPRNGGDEALAALETRHGPLPATWRVLTGGGGEHVFFRHPGNPVNNAKGRLGPGLDLKADGGYVVAPPSEHMSGQRYALSIDHHPDEVPLADAPDWLLATAPTLRGARRSQSPSKLWLRGDRLAPVLRVANRRRPSKS